MAKAPIASDPVTDAIEPGQLVDFDADHVARPCPLVPPHRHQWLEVFQVAQANGFESAANGGEGQCQQAGDAPDGGALMMQGNCPLQMLWIVSAPAAGCGEH